MAPGTIDQFSRATITLICEPDDQGRLLMRELQRTRARVVHRWPMPERIGEGTDIVIVEFDADIARRYVWMPGEASAAVIVLLPQSGRYDMRRLQAALPDAVIHRPYLPHAIVTALTVGWDHFSYARRQRIRIQRLDENVRALRDIERAKHYIMEDKNTNENNAFNILRTMAMERRMTVAAIAASIVDSRQNLG